MIFITGDTHGDIDIDVLFEIKADYPNLSKKDYVIVAGDFSGYWSEMQWIYTLEIMKDLPFTLLFVDGNHENFDILNSYKIEEWNGGKIHKLSEDVIHLMRGEVYKIDGLIILTIGGAESTDKEYRKEHISWWKDESITNNDIKNALYNLAKVNNKVDIVITHTMPLSVLYQEPFYSMTRGIPKNSEIKLEEIKKITDYKKWYFGHWHLDKELKNNFYCLYKKYLILKQH